MKRWKTDTKGAPNVWTSGSVRDIISDERYTGKSIYGKTKVVSIGSKKHISVPREEWIVAPGAHELLVLQDDYDKAQEVQKRLVHKSGKERPKSWADRNVHCGHCGYAMAFYPVKK